MRLDNFHPAVSAAFFRHFEKPTEVQLQSWAAIKSSQHTLVSLPESLVSYQKTHFDPGELVHILTA